MPLAGDLSRPDQGALVGGRQVAEVVAGQQVALHVMHTALDLALVLRRAHPAGGQEEAVMLGQLLVAALDDRVLVARLDDGGLEVVQHDAPGHAAEEGEGVLV